MTVAQSQIRKSARFIYVGLGAGLGMLACALIGGNKGLKAAEGSQVHVEVYDPDQGDLSFDSVFPDCFLQPANEAERLGVEVVAEGGGDGWRFGSNVYEYSTNGLLAGSAIAAVIGVAIGKRWVDAERDAVTPVDTGGRDSAIRVDRALWYLRPRIAL